jgi:small subunit ribosomal protein S7
MPRRGYKRQTVKNDPLYGSFEVSKLIRYAMKDGKKSVAEKHVYSAFEMIKSEKNDPVTVLEVAVNNVAPRREVKPRRVGGASYLVPIETRPQRRLFLALNWILNAANSRSNKQYSSFDKKLHAELMDAFQNQGEAVNKKLQVEKLAEANKAFAHYRW